MNLLTLIGPVPAAPLLARTTSPVRSRVYAAAGAMDATIDPGAGRDNPQLAGFVVMPSAGVARTGTSCARPMWIPECRRVAPDTGLNIGLLRFDPDRGATFDILPPDDSDPLCRYVAWRRLDSDLWFIPTAGETPYVRANGWGLSREDTPPFKSAAERTAGIISAIDHSSFEPRF